MVGLACGLSLRKISQKLGRNHRTIAREVKRNSPYFQKYVACRADKKTIKRGIQQRTKAPLKNPEVYLYVREHLRMGWSPEQIVGRLRLEFKLKICVETVYQYIYKNKREKLWRYLRLARKKRMRKGFRKVRSGRIPNAVSIDARPKLVNRRKQIGHWESDLMLGKRSGPVVSTTVERSTRYTLLTKLGNQTAQAKLDALQRLGLFPQKLRQTLTVDNGKENTRHEELTETLSLAVYFCHAYSAWEKGTVENTIQRLRRYLPKGQDLTGLNHDAITLIETKLNHTPRKCLGYFTPHEKMMLYLKSTS